MDEYGGMRKFGREVEKMKCGPDGRHDDIVEQIEREQGGRVSRMRVLSVVTEMERHVSGAEGMGDSPVARWARELRGRLAAMGATTPPTYP